jgi:hypothetical protein
MITIDARDASNLRPNMDSDSRAARDAKIYARRTEGFTCKASDSARIRIIQGEGMGIAQHMARKAKWREQQLSWPLQRPDYDDEGGNRASTAPPTTSIMRSRVIRTAKCNPNDSPPLDQAGTSLTLIADRRLYWIGSPKRFSAMPSGHIPLWAALCCWCGWPRLTTTMCIIRTMAGPWSTTDQGIAFGHERSINILQTETFGRLGFVEVGALSVRSHRAGMHSMSLSGAERKIGVSLGRLGHCGVWRTGKLGSLRGHYRADKGRHRDLGKTWRCGGTARRRQRRVMRRRGIIWLRSGTCCDGSSLPQQPTKPDGRHAG